MAVIKLSSFRYIFPEAFTSMKRNSWMTVASIVTVAITLFLCGVFWILYVSIDANASLLESNVEIKVYIREGTSPESTKDLGQKIEKLSGVKNVSYVSKEDALKDMKKRFGEDSDMVTAIGDTNPLPDSYTVKAETPNDVIKISNNLEKLFMVEQVSYGQGAVEKLFSALNWLRILGLVIMGLLGLSTIILIAMTIRLTVIARQDEIKIMKYVGASDSFIRWPFLLEGVFLGLFGAILAWGGTLLAYGTVLEKVAKDISFIYFVPMGTIAWQLILGMSVFGIVLGALGSTVSLRRFLKV